MRRPSYSANFQDQRPSYKEQAVTCAMTLVDVVVHEAPSVKFCVGRQQGKGLLSIVAMYRKSYVRTRNLKMIPINLCLQGRFITIGRVEREPCLSILP